MKITLKEVNKLAIPAILAGISEPLLSLVDLAIVGNMTLNSGDSLAALGIAGTVLNAFIWIFAQTKTAISAVVSRHFGAKSLKKIYSLVPQTILLTLIVGLLVAFVSNLFVDEIFYFFKASPEVHGLTTEYFSIRSWGFIITLMTFTLFGVFRGMQNTIWAMNISIAGAVLNAGLDFAFVGGVDGFITPMGVRGAAFASLIAQGFMFALAVWIYLKKTGLIPVFSRRINTELKPLLQLAGNFILRAITLNITLYLASIFASTYGTKYAAAHAVALNIWLFSAFFIDGYANAGNAISGRLLGEKNFTMLRKLIPDLLKYASIVGVLLGLVYLIFYTSLGVFFIKDKETLKEFQGIFWLVILFQPINAIAFTYDGVFKGLGEAAFLRNLLIVATGLGFLPVLFLLDFLQFKLVGVWFAFFAWMLLRSIVPHFKFRVKFGRA